MSSSTGPEVQALQLEKPRGDCLAIGGCERPGKDMAPRPPLGEYRVALMAVFVHAFVRGYRPIPLRYVIIGAYFDGVGGVGVDDTVGAAGGGVVVGGGR